MDHTTAVMQAPRSPGRLETIRTSPRVWADASHDPAGMARAEAATGTGSAAVLATGIVVTATGPQRRAAGDRKATER